MEIYIATAIIGLGYALSENNKIKNKKVEKKSVPNGNNIFNSNRVNEIRWKEQIKSDNNYRNMYKNKKSKLVDPGPSQYYYNKVDYAENNLPIEFEDPSNRNGSLENPVSGNLGYSLSGEPITANTFKHNNMQPFFGSTVKQNLGEYSNNSIMENFTGKQNFYRKKSEIPQMFNPEANISNPYGMSNLSGYQRNRYIASNKRTNEAPTEKIYVGPGLDKGYTWKPSGGFQQADTRKYVLPKTVDELRVKTNPKLVYHRPVIPGSRPSKVGKVGIVSKNRPDTFAEWGPDRYFITTGDRIKPKQRGEVVLKHSNRTTTDIRRAMGPAGPKDGFSKRGIRSNVKVTEKCQYTPGGPRGVDGSGKWNIPEECPKITNNYVPMKKCDGNTMNINKLSRTKGSVYTDSRHSTHSIHDYGKSGFNLNITNRDETQCIPNGNITGVEQQKYVPITSELRPTRKQDVVGNTRWASNVQMPYNRGDVRDPSHIARTTIKETLLHEAPLTNMGTHVPNAIAYDPTHVAKTTIKETLLHETPLTNMGTSVPNAMTYDPDDKLKTTHKETTLSEYTGNAYEKKEGSYTITDIDPRYTNRQYTSNNSHIGIAGSKDVKHRNTDGMMDNVITRSYRESLSKGRTPAMEGPKDNINSNLIHATTNKFGDLQNKLYSQRAKVSNKVYNSLPQANDCSRTKQKKTLSNVPIRNRLDSTLLDEFRKNPYSQSLESYWTY